MNNGMKERKQRIISKRKKGDEGITWKQESYFLLIIFVFIKDLVIDIIKFNHGKHQYVSLVQRKLRIYSRKRCMTPRT